MPTATAMAIGGNGGVAQVFTPITDPPLFARLPGWALALVLASGLALAVLSAAHALATRGAGLAWPQNGLAQARLAARLAGPALAAQVKPGGQDAVAPAAGEDAALLARRALVLEPTADRALSTLALMDTTEDPSTALSMHRLVRQMTRRNEISTLVLAVHALEQRQFAAALGDLGVILRLQPALREDLMPLIVQLLQDEAAIAPLAQLLRRERGWAEEFWRIAPDFQPGLANLVALRLALLDTPGAVLARHDEFVLQALVNDGQFAQAETLASQIVPAFQLPEGDLLRNSAFANVPRGRPFDWRLFASATTHVFHDPAADGGQDHGANALDGSLTISATPGPGGVIASQLVRLAPLPHSLQIILAPRSQPPGAMLRVEVTCASRPGEGPQAFTGSQAAAGVRFAPVPGCAYHFVTLHLAPRTTYPAGDIVLDRIILRAAD